MVVKGSNPNALGDYADLTDVYDAEGNLSLYGDGKNDYGDLEVFVGEYGWDANDPNTW